MTADLLFRQGRSAQQQGSAGESERLYRAVLDAEPSHADANRFLGILLLERGQAEQARLFFERAIAAKPTQASYHQNMAMALSQLGDHTRALEACEKALWLKPDYALAYYNRGEALLSLSRFQDAIMSFQRAITLGLTDGRPHAGMGIAYYLQERFDVSRACFEEAKKRSPTLAGLNGRILLCAMRICDWSGFDELSRAAIADVEVKNQPTEPFLFLALPTTPAQQKHCAEIYAVAECPPQPALTATSRRAGPLRIAYVSKDFCDHPVTYLMAEILERHDRANFEIFAVSYGDKENAGRARIIKAADHFIDVRDLTDRQAAGKIAELDIDIAIELSGYTGDARPKILSFRPARIQVNYLGYAGTMGASHLDYLIGDAVATPLEQAPHFTEKLIQLPVCYLPPASRPAPGDGMTVTRTACNLPENAIVFCAFNNSYKIRPDMFAVWVRLLSATPGSVLWLRDDNALAARNLKKEAQSHGIDPARLVFSPRVGAREHFARLALADIFLDTAPYNAHTTAADALWAGVPLVTLLGETFPGRVAASLLTQAGLTELIAPSLAAYENLALQLVSDSDRRHQLRRKLAQNREHLFDAPAFTRHLEDAYKSMTAP